MVLLDTIVGLVVWIRDESKTGRYQLPRLYRVFFTKAKMVEYRKYRICKGRKKIQKR
jgi:hypothetical protein